MFTGITQGVFPIVALSNDSEVWRYRIACDQDFVTDLQLGASVAVEGVCQTVVARDGTELSFEAITETRQKTTLGQLFVGREVSLERSVRWGEEIGGHEVSGHVFERGCVIEQKQHPNHKTLIIRCSSHCISFIYEKGFIALDGSSLTVGEVDIRKNCFAIHLIPETLRLTNLGKKAVGDEVNIEPEIKTKILVESMQRILAPIERRFTRLEEKVQALIDQAHS